MRAEVCAYMDATPLLTTNISEVAMDPDMTRRKMSTEIFIKNAERLSLIIFCLLLLERNIIRQTGMAVYSSAFTWLAIISSTSPPPLTFQDFSNSGLKGKNDWLCS